MKRRLLIALLAAGAVGGFATGIASLGCHRARFERHVARRCVEAARAIDRDEARRGPSGPDRAERGPSRAPKTGGCDPR